MLVRMSINGESFMTLGGLHCTMLAKSHLFAACYLLRVIT